MSYNKICYVNTIYPLFIFLLMHVDEKEDELFFFLGKSIPQEIAKRIKNSWHLDNDFKIKNKFLRYKEIYKNYSNLEKFLIKENLMDKEIYLQDNQQYGQFFLNHIDNCFSLEDGIVNYIIKDDLQEKLSLKRII